VLRLQNATVAECPEERVRQSALARPLQGAELEKETPEKKQGQDGGSKIQKEGLQVPSSCSRIVLRNS
jgi:hypothetical protein